TGNENIEKMPTYMPGHAVSNFFNVFVPCEVERTSSFERTGSKVGLIVTKGFRDVLEIGNELRYDLYDLFMRMPEPLVPRFLRRGVSERTLADGSLLQPLDRAAAQTVVRELL